MYASLVCNFRHGREEDEVMGVSFHKELVVDRVQVYPVLEQKGEEKTKMQVRNESSRVFYTIIAKCTR